MEHKTILTVMFIFLRSSLAIKLLSGQTGCRRGIERPCYKIAYFKDVSRRLEFKEAQEACQSDGGDLLSIESENEQRLIEKLIQGLSAGDGDFWIGLWRKGNSADCPSLYQWLDGSKAKFRNWYVDEPSCGSEVCVVMYHQPSASSGMGGPYLYQWNDDRCNMKNNFICKYAPVPGSSTVSPTLTPFPNLTLIPAAGNRSVADKFLEEMVKVRNKHKHFTKQIPFKMPELCSNQTVQAPSAFARTLKNPYKDFTNESTVPVTSSSIEIEKDSAVTVGKSEGNSFNVVYIVIPTIPLLVLLMVSGAVFCFRFFMRRRKERSENAVKEHNFWMEPVRNLSPNLEIYNVIRKQSEADLTGTRPHINNTSFRATTATRGLHSLSGEYDNVVDNFCDSGFVTNDIYESCSDQASRSRESGWVENVIYGY
ncbi:layilin isoform X1 [Narcine bancroftii]|uniref:layilin isoform X1 n=1 Tax=Narcine bancroftii TaxID=1343680 RepID=UPI003831175B